MCGSNAWGQRTSYCIHREPLWRELTVLRTANAALVDKVERLQAWKDSWLKIESEWDAHSVAVMLGGKVGESTRAVIAREVPRLVERVKRLEEAGDCQRSANATADDDIREHLQVANYNLHGLLNTGERITPPNPPQTIHQAGIDTSVRVLERLRFARNEWDKAKATQ
jgi:hypothetical protein